MQKKSFVKAFTLVEVMICVSIVTLILSTVLFNYAIFSDNLALSAAAQDTVLGLRQAQTYGLSVKEATIGGGKFDSAYGIHYAGPGTSSFIFFVDKNEDGQYTAGQPCGAASSECLEDAVLRDKIQIVSICDSVSCPPAGATHLEISFLRPNPDAVIKFFAGTTLVATPGTARIILTSPKGKTQTITVLSTGQISVQ